jgi:hypothetical protein
VKNHAGFIDIDIDFVLRSAAPEDTREIKNSQQNEQSQHNRKNRHCTAAAATCVNVLLYNSVCHHYPPFQAQFLIAWWSNGNAIQSDTQKGERKPFQRQTS